MFKVRKTAWFVVILLSITLTLATSTYSQGITAEDKVDIYAKSAFRALNYIYYSSIREKDLSDLIDTAFGAMLESKETDLSKLLMISIEAMINSLGDQRAGLLTPEFMKELEEMGKPYVGIGAGVTQITDSPWGPIIKILNPFENGPAEEAGLKDGDLIVKIGDTPTKELSLMEAVNLIKGEEGTRVKLLVMRPGAEEPKIFIITRKKVRYNPVKKEVLEPDIGYIKLETFNMSEVSERFKEALSELSQDNAQGLIIDLRNNGGGFLREAMEITRMFMGSGDSDLLLLMRKGRGYTVSLFAYKNTLYEKPVVILINNMSASASEILAGVLQYHKRAILVGVKSLGKGSVQSLYALDNGYWLKFTTEKYYFPNNVTPDGAGIIPDEVIKDNENTPQDEQLLGAVRVMRGLLDKEIN